MTVPRPRRYEAGDQRVRCFGAGEPWLCAADCHCSGRHMWVRAISHVIPLAVLQAVNVDRWNRNVFVCARKLTVGNYVRYLSGLGAVACGSRGLLDQALADQARHAGTVAAFGHCADIDAASAPVGGGLPASFARCVGIGGGFCSIRNWLAACRRRVVPLMVQFPPDWRC